MAIEPRTVLHGIDCARPNASNLPSTENMAGKTYCELERTHLLSDSVLQQWLPHDYFTLKFDYADVPVVNTYYSLGGIIPVNTIIMEGHLQITDPFTDAGGTATLNIIVGWGGPNNILNLFDAIAAGEGLSDIMPTGRQLRSVWTDADRQVAVMFGTELYLTGAAVLYLRCMRRMT